MRRLLVLMAMIPGVVLAQEPCRGKQVEGMWINPHDEIFEITYQDCDQITVKTVKSGDVHQVDLSGRRETIVNVKGGMQWSLEVHESQGAVDDYFLETGSLKWRLANRPDSPALGVEVGLVAIRDYTNSNNPSAQIIELQSRMLGFKYYKGRLDNLFDRGMALAIALANRFHLNRVISIGFNSTNLIRRLPPGVSRWVDLWRWDTSN